MKNLASDANKVDVAKKQFPTNQVASAENQLTANQTRPVVPDGQTGGRSKGRSGQNSARWGLPTMLSNRNKELYNSLYWLRALVRWSPHSSPHCVRPRLCLYWDPPRCPALLPAGNPVKREMELNNRSNFDLLHNFEEKSNSHYLRYHHWGGCQATWCVRRRLRFCSRCSIPFSFPNFAQGSF